MTTESRARYDASEKGKARHRRYQVSEKGKAAGARYDASEKGKARRLKYDEVRGYLTRRTRELTAERDHVSTALEDNRKEQQEWLMNS